MEKMIFSRILEYCTSDVNYIINKFNLNYISDEDKNDIIQCACLECVKYNDNTDGKILTKRRLNYIVKRTMFLGVSLWKLLHRKGGIMIKIKY
jgi:hypothetical protein